MKYFLEFEKPIAELESKITELSQFCTDDSIDISKEISKFQAKSQRLLTDIYENLTAWQKVLVARHPERPQFFDYLKSFSCFEELRGDRCFGDDQAIVGGIAKLDNRSVVVMGQQKGRDINDRIKHNFGMPKPEGYRKVRRLMDLAEKFSLPIISFVDTAGAYPAIEAEERGQAGAIAQCIETSLTLHVPMISIIIGEGGSGGAVSMATSNAVIMLEHSIYSVISPEGCAAILWKTSEKTQDAADSLKLTAQDLLRLGIIERIVKEPLGGAHRALQKTVNDCMTCITEELSKLDNIHPLEILKMRRDKFLKIGRID